MRKESISKKILNLLLIGGVICLACSSPYFVLSVSQQLSKRKFRKKPDPRFNNAFYYLLRKGYIVLERKGHQVKISLTKKGRKKAKKYLIDELKIKKPKKWDGKYRVVVFDIPNITRLKRDALRGKIKALGFYCYQQSVWITPWPCEREIKVLQEFFGLNQKELLLIKGEIKKDAPLRKFFKLK